MRAGLILLFLLLSACGQRGPLYLPEEKQPEAVMSTGDQSGETDEEKDWQDIGAPPATDDGQGATEAGEQNEEKDRKDPESQPGGDRQN